MSVRAENLVWGVKRRVIVDDVSLVVEPNETLGLIGPNGSGKSSLLRLLAGLRRPARGTVAINGKPIAGYGRKELARIVAFVQQSASTDTNVAVEDVVRLGRTPHRSALGAWTPLDGDAVRRALEQVDMFTRRGQRWQTLSGGERQRAHIGRALAQEPSIMFLDEPTNHLDIHHQIEILRLVRDLKITSIVALHDLNLASLFCDRIVVLEAGRIVASGRPEAVLTEDLLRDVFKVEARVRRGLDHGKPEISFAVA
ncbi:MULTISPECIES: ABC transporter ATP-binding protein [Paracoccus]|uniref:Iron complex transport system ATP-binding protein n=1 Tax=Paracoccus versutus TaxID=34007 RepID=A0A3D9XR86_PARVE|nr:MULTISPECIES: ABC transporter ATP-binding protein [Paracoccus]MBT0781132.1 ABC transporter ATP-binding protein [Paracoccus sp. pheM1]REF72957.1 iron complex transport system ATP-binding protein [Paracoccus versutus]WGR55119.1 ABC transporter ATP-binding protein [Paracoccus versutus]